MNLILNAEYLLDYNKFDVLLDSGESHMSPKTLYPYNNYVKTEEKEESNSYMKGLSEFICLPNQEGTYLF